MKHLFLTVSVFTLLSTPSFATWQQDVEDQVSLEVGQNKIVQKLLKSQDYTIDLDEGALVNKITKVVEVKNQDQIIGDEVNHCALLSAQLWDAIGNRYQAKAQT